jgi:hypothetical protein
MVTRQNIKLTHGQLAPHYQRISSKAETHSGRRPMIAMHRAGRCLKTKNHGIPLVYDIFSSYAIV